MYFLIDHHCETQPELTEMLKKNSPNSLNVLLNENVQHMKKFLGFFFLVFNHLIFPSDSYLPTGGKFC